MTLHEISRRARAVPSSATLSIAARAAELRADGVDVIDLSVGQPDFDTPAYIRQGAAKAMETGATRYTPTAGTPALRRAVAQAMAERTGVAYEPSQVLVSSGAKQSLHNILQVIVDPGDEVLVPSPYWVSYPPMVTLAQGELRLLPTRLEDGFRLTPHQLQAALSPRSRVLILNSPSNPTGAGYNEQEMRALADLVLAHPRLVVLSDEIYAALVYEGYRHTSFASLGAEQAARCFLVDGVSKAYAMTGWRIGFALGDAAVIAAGTRIQDHTTSCASSISQAAALAAVTGPPDSLESMRGAFEARRQVLLRRIGAVAGLDVYPPQGAFYAFVRLSRELLAGREDTTVAEALLERAHVAVVPGSVFGAPGHLRLSFALSRKRIEEAMDRIESALEEKA